jgi:hypothetical protein
MGFTLQDTLPLHPMAIGSACWLCGAGGRDVMEPDRTVRKERYVNPDRDIDYEGGVFFCETCVREMGRLVGLVEPTAIVEAQAERDAAFEAAAVAEQAKDEAEGVALSLLTLAQTRPFVAEPVAEPAKAKPARKATAKA